MLRKHEKEAEQCWLIANLLVVESEQKKKGKQVKIIGELKKTGDSQKAPNPCIIDQPKGTMNKRDHGMYISEKLFCRLRTLGEVSTEID